MHVFIDESGLFMPSQERSVWSSVGGVAIPGSSLSDVESALLALKQAHGIAPDEEFKRNRPDCTSTAYIQFIRELKKLECTLHVVSTRGDVTEAQSLERHKEETIFGITNYGKKNLHVAKHASKIVDVIKNISDQQYNQFVLQVELIFDILNKAISYYSKILPRELGCFAWVVDRKDKITETQYEFVFTEIYSGLMLAYSVSRGLALMSADGYDYYYLVAAYSNERYIEGALNFSKVNFGKNLKAVEARLQAIDIGSLLRGNFRLEDSVMSAGLQVADLLVSSVNRCLKRNYDNNEKMAAELGSLMINSPYIDGRALTVRGHSKTGEIGGEAAKLIELMDGESKKLFSDIFRSNHSRNFPLRWA